MSGLGVVTGVSFLESHQFFHLLKTIKFLSLVTIQSGKGVMSLKTHYCELLNAMFIVWEKFRGYLINLFVHLFQDFFRMLLNSRPRCNYCNKVLSNRFVVLCNYKLQQPIIRKSGSIQMGTFRKVKILFFF